MWFCNVTSAKNTFQKLIFMILFPQFLQRVMSSLKFDVDYLPDSGGTEKIQQSNSLLYLVEYRRQKQNSISKT